MELVKRLVRWLDRWQQGHPPAAIAYGVLKKFGNDQANQYVVALGWYGFTAIYPLLLVVVTVFGMIGAASLGHGIISTLHRFPVVGSMFNPASPSTLHGSTLGLAIGLLGLVYGATGVTQTALQGFSRAWNIPLVDQPGLVPRLVRSLAGLTIIGGAFVVNAVAATYATSNGHNIGVRIAVIAGMVVLNFILYTASFRVLTPNVVNWRGLLPGAFLAGLGFTLLITVGSGLVQHQLANSSNTYGQFGMVIGLVGFLFLLAKITFYSAELNPVLSRHLWPRSLQNEEPTPADRQVLADVARQWQSRHDERIGVGIGPDAPRQAADDALSQPLAEEAEPPRKPETSSR